MRGSEWVSLPRKTILDIITMKENFDIWEILTIRTCKKNLQVEKRNRLLTRIFEKRCALPYGYIDREGKNIHLSLFLNDILNKIGAEVDIEHFIHQIWKIEKDVLEKFGYQVPLSFKNFLKKEVDINTL